MLFTGTSELLYGQVNFWLYLSTGQVNNFTNIEFSHKRHYAHIWPRAAYLCSSMNVSRFLCRVNQLHREVLTLRTQLKSCKKQARVCPLSLSHTHCTRMSRVHTSHALRWWCIPAAERQTQTPSWYLTRPDTFTLSGLVKCHITPASPGQCVLAQKELISGLRLFTPNSPILG